jgi:hypothetical protein
VRKTESFLCPNDRGQGLSITGVRSARIMDSPELALRDFEPFLDHNARETRRDCNVLDINIG